MVHALRQRNWMENVGYALASCSALVVQLGPSITGLFYSLPQDTLSLAAHLGITVLSLLLLIALATFAQTGKINWTIY